MTLPLSTEVPAGMSPLEIAADRAILTGMVARVMFCPSVRCGGVCLDKRTAVSFTVGRGRKAQDAVLCASCFDTVSATPGFTFTDVRDGRQLWKRGRK